VRNISDVLPTWAHSMMRSNPPPHSNWRVAAPIGVGVPEAGTRVRLGGFFFVSSLRPPFPWLPSTLYLLGPFVSSWFLANMPLLMSVMQGFPQGIPPHQGPDNRGAQKGPSTTQGLSSGSPPRHRKLSGGAL